MAILVLGGAGYIGSHMVDRLVEKGQEKVVVVDSLVTGHRAAVHPDAIFALIENSIWMYGSTMTCYQTIYYYYFFLTFFN